MRKALSDSLPRLQTDYIDLCKKLGAEPPVAAVDLSLDEATLARLDEIFPGPGNQAAQAYAG
jgi:aryl-alcohol dehydrogenase-like predicted oxidoreductase